MQQEDDNYRSEFTSCNITPEKLQETPRTGKLRFGRRDIMSSQEVKRRINYTPQKTPNKHPKTPQGTEPLKKDAKSQLEATKRKSLSPCKETPEKIQKTCSSGKFINTLIAQWSKHMGVQTPVQSPGKQENLTSMNQELQLQLQKITEEKQDLTTAFTEKDDEITKLQEKIITCK
ncbi:hypothetical protein E2986_07883 [Frieseomelitta varia]|uniref:Uncharacterized protein n=1 Tax=Frieseomelitta varia TaxID=561572 RepID=A0A833VSB5_9HYME|nr:hypothetical protein E2986_07883 [Frieseomelitta varia]